METSLVKKNVINAFTSILNDLNLKEVEDIQDLLSVKLYQLTDKGERISLEEVKKQLKITTPKTE